MNLKALFDDALEKNEVTKKIVPGPSHLPETSAVASEKLYQWANDLKNTLYSDFAPQHSLGFEGPRRNNAKLAASEVTIRVDGEKILRIAVGYNGHSGYRLFDGKNKEAIKSEFNTADIDQVLEKITEPVVRYLVEFGAVEHKKPSPPRTKGYLLNAGP